MPYISTERVAEVRRQLKERFPHIKFSVTKEHSSTVNVAIMESPYDWPEPYMQLNHFYLEHYPNTELLEEIREIANAGNGTLVEDGDYGTVPRFYIGLDIGKWDRPHVKTELTAEVVRKAFNNVIAQTQDADRIAKLEVCREYFTNPEFKERLQEYVFARTQ